MALTTGPLFSLDASGSVAKTIVFSKWKGRNYVRRHAMPAQPRSGKQVSMRAMLKFLTQAWDTVSSPNKASWETLAAQAAISPFNSYVGHNQARWRNFLNPDPFYPPSTTNPSATAPTVTATAGERQITLQIADAGTAPDWAWLIYRKFAGAVTPGIDTLIAVVPHVNGNTFYVDTPLAPGQYFYSCSGLSIGALFGAQGIDDATVV